MTDDHAHGNKQCKKDARKTAVALKNDPNLPDLPEIAAIGHGHWAEKILELAYASDIPVREDAELTDILALLEEEHEIPVEAIMAVAEILSYIYAFEGYETNPDPDSDLPSPFYPTENKKE